MPRCSQLVSLLVALVLFSVCAWAQQYQVLHNFTSTAAAPSTGLTVDSKGNAYGATVRGGDRHTSGTVYEISRTRGYQLLYSFTRNGAGGDNPRGNLTLDSAGNLYGTAPFGGLYGQDCVSNGCGVVFELSPPVGGSGQWTETVLYSFCQQKSCADGANPAWGVIFDSAGNLYGTTEAGGGSDFGTVFELSPSSGGWTEHVLESFNGTNGELPVAGLVFDGSGNLYGTTSAGTGSGGTVFELSPSGATWVESILHVFGPIPDGNTPEANLVFDSAGNLYGTTQLGGEFSCGGSGCGTVFELTPAVGGWTENVIYSFDGDDGENPVASVVLDAAGNVYGTTSVGGDARCGESTGCGTVFRLTPESGGQWTETFFKLPGGSGGANPVAQLTLDASGNVYGTTANGGNTNSGVLFEIKQ